MKRVLVTGGFGRAGPWVIEQFLENGYEVACVDRAVPDASVPDVTFFQADLSNQGAAWELVFGYDPDAIVHLASLARDSGTYHGTEVFSKNAMMTYNVLLAAGHADVPVAWTSSEMVLCPIHDDGNWRVDRLPIDETSPTQPVGPYATSKLTGEVVAGAVAREYGIPVASVRPSWVVRPADVAGIPGPTYEMLSGIRAEFESDPPDSSSVPGSSAMSWNLWSYVDVRDLARLLRVAVESDLGGHDTFLAVADENYIDRPTADVAAAIAGDLPPECSLEGDQPGESNAKAKRVLGWTPEHSWRTASGADVSAPTVLESL